MSEQFDAIVVGSGATGGWAAMDLASRGLHVALLEAGPEIPFGAPPDPAGPALDPQRQTVQARCYAFEEGTAHLFVDDIDNPYSHPDGMPFDWIRCRQVGGRLHTWGRMCLRMSDRELKAGSRDGLSEDWPISYADLAPYYDRVERFLRVCGTPEGLPQLPDGEFAEPSPLFPAEEKLKQAVESRWPDRRVTGARIALAPPDAMLSAAARTGRLELRPDSVAARIVTGSDGRAQGVAYVERVSKRERQVDGRVIFLCASAIESTRLLLNSSDPQHPDGLGNSSGALGHYLMDHTYGVGVTGVIRQPVHSPRDRKGYGAIIPCFRNVAGEDADFARGYGIEMWLPPPTAGPVGRLISLGRRRAERFWIKAFGEVLPRYENQVSLRPEEPDAWGIPTVRIECRYGENEARLVADQAATINEMAEAAGLEVLEAVDQPAPPGLSVHEMGTARMGSDPATSVLDPENRCWGADNVLVTDGACFPSGGHQNPTLTMMALTARACDLIAARMKRGEL